MARPSVAARTFSQTEELERLEQSITLTLQEIDHNFSKAHRIVTTSILPVVEQYGENSKAIWEASKFWKQFFEASANVSLSGYEELANDESTVMDDESTAMRDDGDASSHAHGDEDETPSRHHSRRDVEDDDDESMLDDAELAGSTPRPAASRVARTPTESPYEAMRREMKDEEGGRGGATVLDEEDDEEEEEEEDSSILFAQQTARLPDVTLTPKALLDRRNMDPSTGGKDPLLHRVLDKNYRIQATPHKPTAKGTPVRGQAAAAWQDSPASSPEMAIPKLRSEAFMSPYKSLTAAGRAGSAAAAAEGSRRRFTPGRGAAAASSSVSRGPRTPGVSVQTPMSRKTRQALADGSLKGKQKYEIDWESDEDDDDDLYGGMSPPKTIQFALPPSKLLQTPAINQVTINDGCKE
ncbi:DASH complex, subunit Ask1 [Cordyceps fumosorosea ARSEF 2679]|uniref:DASH complex subunit ASK1 n=1 Tax=Cordyceps fumosorosea (strain ARSEF 2679) TaxID=1081104 RepID=A0A167UBN3_CORFA|nr:DASH complex, subunit Ask1 [Cordyceps fumosorosea ARSEF 2679]OAA61423.1 DASH complex, subunit Ask1 [Cordyceps fumosorosea ARSEF 2679]